MPVALPIRDQTPSEYRSDAAKTSIRRRYNVDQTLFRVQDFTGLKRLRRIAGERFRMGVLLYDGDHTTSLGDGLFAVPIGALWS